MFKKSLIYAAMTVFLMGNLFFMAAPKAFGDSTSISSQTTQSQKQSQSSTSSSSASSSSNASASASASASSKVEINKGDDDDDNDSDHKSEEKTKYTTKYVASPEGKKVPETGSNLVVLFGLMILASLAAFVGVKKYCVKK